MKKLLISVTSIAGVFAILAIVFGLLPSGFEKMTIPELLSQSWTVLKNGFTFSGLLNILIAVGCIAIVCVWIVEIIFPIVKKRKVAITYICLYFVFEALSVYGLLVALRGGSEPILKGTASWNIYCLFAFSFVGVLAGICMSFASLTLEDAPRGNGDSFLVNQNKDKVSDVAKETIPAEKPSETPVFETKVENNDNGNVVDVKETPVVSKPVVEEKKEEPKAEVKEESKPEEKVEKEEEVKPVKKAAPKKVNKVKAKEEVKPVEEVKEAPAPETKPVEEVKEAPAPEVKPEETEAGEVKEENDKTSDKDAMKVYHVSKRAKDGKWTIKFANGQKVIKLFDTKVEALAFANDLAKNQGGSVAFHASKGKNKGKLRSLK